MIRNKRFKSARGLSIYLRVGFTLIWGWFEYGLGWFRSGLTLVLGWILEGITAPEARLKTVKFYLWGLICRPEKVWGGGGTPVFEDNPIISFHLSAGLMRVWVRFGALWSALRRSLPRFPRPCEPWFASCASTMRHGGTSLCNEMKTENRGQRTEDREQGTESRGQRTAGRGQAEALARRNGGILARFGAVSPECI